MKDVKDFNGQRTVGLLKVFGSSVQGRWGVRPFYGVSVGPGMEESISTV